MRKMFSKNQIGEIAKQNSVYIYFASCKVIDEAGDYEYGDSYALLMSKDPNLQIIEEEILSPYVILQLTVADDEDTYFAVNPELTINGDYLSFTDGGKEDILDPIIKYSSISKIL